MTARLFLLGLALTALPAGAAVYVCEEGGIKVFRDRPCAEGDQPAAPKGPKKPAWDDPVPAAMTIEVFSQVVGLRLPAHWKPGHQSVKPLTYMAEFVPVSQSVQEWGEMITVQGMRDIASRITPQAFLQGLAARIAKTCPAHYIAEFLGETSIDAFPAYTAILGCSRFTAPAAGARAGQGEVAVYAAIQGTNDLYLVHRAVRGDRFDGGKPPIVADNATAILQALEIKICERGEAQCATRKPRTEPSRTRPPSSPRPGREAAAGAAPPPG